MHVVATAGHVDHGKSTLVRALTGQDPDRLEEERRRGLSVQLGYCWTDLPGAGEVAFVDVPGHERFVPTMLSGVGPVPAVLFVVAADDPWMPQAAEHLAALDALAIGHGVLVVTRADLADPAPALARARTELAGTTLADVPHVVVSARTGAGLDDLRAALVELVAGLPEPAEDAAVRVWVDRRFHVRGTGTVVTGTLPAGTVRAGDVLSWDGHDVRVRAVQALGGERPSVSGPARVALALGGDGGVERGEPLVTPGAFEVSAVVDVRLRGGERLPERPVLHVGSTALEVHARPLGETHARLTLPRGLPWRVGDRAVLRDPGRRLVWGAQVLDPAPPALDRRGAAARRAAALAEADLGLADELRRRGVVDRETLARRGLSTEVVPAGALVCGRWLVAAEHAATLRQRLQELVAGEPTGLPVAAVARALELPDPVLVEALVPGTGLRVLAGRVRPASSSLPEHLATALAEVSADLAADPFAAPPVPRLRELGLDAGALARLAHDGHLLRLAPDVVLLPGADDRAVDVLAGLPSPFTVSEARAALGTSRRVALPLLAHLDRTGRTTRLADDSRRLRGV